MNQFISRLCLSAIVAVLGLSVLSTPRASADEIPFRMDGSFTFANIHGNLWDVFGNGHASLGGKFTFHNTVRIEYGGREIDATLTFVFANGSTLTITYEVPIVNGYVWGAYSVIDGTGQFQGATGSGIIEYQIGQGAPFTVAGSIIR